MQKSFTFVRFHSFLLDVNMQAGDPIILQIGDILTIKDCEKVFLIHCLSVCHCNLIHDTHYKYHFNAMPLNLIVTLYINRLTRVSERNFVRGYEDWKL